MRSLSDLNTRETPRQIIFEDFKIDLPIKGGWGCSIDDACIIDKNDIAINKSLPFDGLSIQNVFVEKRIYEEMIIFRPPDEQYAGIRWNLEKQEIISKDGNSYDHLVFIAEGFTGAIWKELTDRFEVIQKAERYDQMPELDAYRESKIFRFTREFYFDVTSFYGQ